MVFILILVYFFCIVLFRSCSYSNQSNAVEISIYSAGYNVMPTSPNPLYEKILPCQFWMDDFVSKQT